MFLLVVSWSLKLHSSVPSPRFTSTTRYPDSVWAELKRRRWARKPPVGQRYGTDYLDVAKMKYVEEWFLAGARDSNRKMQPDEMQATFLPTD
jgi:hypothetical protein